MVAYDEIIVGTQIDAIETITVQTAAAALKMNSRRQWHDIKGVKQFAQNKVQSSLDSGAGLLCGGHSELFRRLHAGYLLRPGIARRRSRVLIAAWALRTIYNIVYDALTATKQTNNQQVNYAGTDADRQRG